MAVGQCALRESNWPDVYRALSDCAAFGVQDERSKDLIGKELIRSEKRFINVPQ